MKCFKFIITPFIQTPFGNRIQLSSVVYLVPENMMEGPGADFPLTLKTLTPQFPINLPVNNSALACGTISFEIAIENGITPQPEKLEEIVE